MQGQLLVMPRGPAKEEAPTACRSAAKETAGASQMSTCRKALPAATRS